MFAKTLAAALLTAVGSNAWAALATGDIAFTSLNADEDGWALVSFVDIAANTTVFFTDNEWNGSAIGAGGAFNTGESYSQWNTGANVISAGTVVRFNNVDNASTLGVSAGTFARLTVSGSANWGVSTTADTVYAYLGSAGDTPATFLTAISNATDGSLANTGLAEGVNAIRLNAIVASASPDFGEYNGARSGLSSFAAYQPLVNDVANWTVDTTNGIYATTAPNTAAFTVSAVPLPAALPLMLSGVGLLGVFGRRRKSGK